jgi:hypothetical protein
MATLETTARAPADRERLLALGAGLVTVSLWASAFVGIRSASHHLSPGALALGRLTIASLALGSIVLWRREPLDDDLCSLGGEPPQPTLLPRVDEPARCRVVADRCAGGREAEPSARALTAALHRPRGRRAAARTERRLDPLQLVTAAETELPSATAAHHAALRQKQLEHLPTLGPRP